MNGRIKEANLSMTQQGLALVELMVAMVIGLMLIGGVIQIFASNKQGYMTHEALSRLQENGRYAMEILSRNVRMAGFTGCAALDTWDPKVIATDATSIPAEPPMVDLDTSSALRGYEVSGGSWNPSYVGADALTAPGTVSSPVVNGADVISVNRGADCVAYLGANMANRDDDITLNAGNSCNFQDGDVLIISDCTSTDIFRVSSWDGTNNQIEHDSTENSENGRLSKAYGSGARVFKLSTYDYYIKLNANSEPSLYVREDGVESELVEGVEDMTIVYGIDTSGDRAVDSYVAAASVTDWGEVASVRVELGLRSLNDNIALNSTTYNFDGASVTNRYLRRNMQTTIGIRNRLP